jgi:Spy/CpxP family protein refolding chaperone
MESLKTPPFLLIGCPVIIVIAVIFYATTYSGFHQSALHAGLLDAETPSAESKSDSSAEQANILFRQRRMERAFAELGLTDVQREQIAVIRKTVTDRGQRHDAIMAVLTPEQRAKWQRIRGSLRNQSPPSASPSPSTGANAGN